MQITNSIKFTLDAGQNAALSLLDLSAAFDMISHELLLHRLTQIEVEGKAWTWLRSLLEERKQAVWLNPRYSDAKKHTYGVPQGSAHSPTLFNIYMMPLAYLIDSFGISVFSYADDHAIATDLQQ